MKRYFFHYKLLEARETVLPQYYCEKLAHFKWCTGEGRKRKKKYFFWAKTSVDDFTEWKFLFSTNKSEILIQISSTCSIFTRTFTFRAHLLHPLQHSFCLLVPISARYWEISQRIIESKAKLLLMLFTWKMVYSHRKQELYQILVENSVGKSSYLIFKCTLVIFIYS